MQTNHKFISLKDKMMDEAHHRFDHDIGNPMSWFSHRSTGRQVALFSQERERDSNSEAQSNESSEAQKILKIQADRALEGEQEAFSKLSDLIRKFFLESRGTKYSQRQSSSCFCKRGELNERIHRYNF